MNKAFTLVELAIVIVIIGLLVGGVLQGQELIKQARIRADIKRLSSIETAIAAFYGKYNFIPGDFPASHAERFLNLPANLGGNGDGKLEWSGTGAGDSHFFWLHLSRSNLINITNGSCSPLGITASSYASFKTDGCSIKSSLTYAHTDDLYRGVSNVGVSGLGNSITVAANATSSGHVAAPAYSPDVVRSIDEKIDDGVAIRGKFRGANSRDINLQPTACLDSSRVYLNDDSTIACRFLYEFGL